LGGAAVAAQAPRPPCERRAMTWFKRSFWLLAWGAWVWAGAGLYRELPRSVGGPLIALPLADNDRVLGYIAGDNLIVAEAMVMAYGGGRYYAVWDAGTGAKLHSLAGPTIWHGGRASLRHGVAIGLHRDDDGPTPQSMQVLDLRTGRWKKLGPDSWNLLAIHPTRSWTLFTEDSRSSRLLIVDFVTGEQVFKWTATSASGRPPILEGQFLPDSDEMMIAADAADGRKQSDNPWTLIHLSPTRGELARMTIDRPQLTATLPVRGGRAVLYGGQRDEGVIEVVEFPSGNVVFSSASLPAGVRAATADDWKSPPTLSPGGRGLLTSGGRLWSIDAGMILWERTPLIIAGQRDPPGGSFAVVEDWKKLLERMGVAATSDLLTTAVRDLETGRVCVRYWGAFDLSQIGPDDRTAIDGDGSIYPLPVLVNYPLLLLCQSILALPLLLTWFILWRRRRRVAVAIP